QGIMAGGPQPPAESRRRTRAAKLVIRGASSLHSATPIRRTCSRSGACWGISSRAACPDTVRNIVDGERTARIDVLTVGRDRTIPARLRRLLGGVVAAACVWMATPAAAQIDMTGFWTVSFDIGVVFNDVPFTQNGTALTSGLGTGTIDPATGV